MHIAIVLLVQIIPSIYAFSIPLLAHLNAVVGASEQKPLLQESLDVWIEREEAIALDRLLANVAPGGRNVAEGDVADGTVIASPSQDEPDYWYQWVRDAAITMSTVVNLYSDATSSPLGTNLSTILYSYAALQYSLQHLSNPSGDFETLSGLGEPKFTTAGTPFHGSWGRPQRDGPALRALTMVSYLRALNASRPELWASKGRSDIFDLFYAASMPPNSVIKADLEYVSHFWNETSFDLWEEVDGMHFFTLITSARALREGSVVAGLFGDVGAAEWYATQAAKVEELVQRFWNKEKGWIVSMLWSKKSGLDCGTLLGSLHALPPEGSNNQAIFPPWSDEILITLLALTRDQQSRFPINAPSFRSRVEQDHTAALEGTGIGRYPEDVYDGYTTSARGGNPWFLCTCSAAEILYRTVSRFTSSSSLTITPLSLPFYTALLPRHAAIMARTYSSTDPLFTTIVARLMSVGDEFLSVVRKHVDSEGSMSEQFDRETGYMRGARDLTWSYGAFLQAVRARSVAGGV